MTASRKPAPNWWAQVYRAERLDAHAILVQVPNPTGDSLPTTDIRVLDLEPGHVIAVPFAGYGDLLAEITNTERRGYLLDVTVREPDGFSYTTVLPAEPDDVTIRTYPAEAAGTWQQ